MKIQDQSVVTMTYVLRENDENGPILQETTKENPFVCIFGMHQLLPKFEENLMGKEPGDHYAFHLTPEEGYGERDEAYVMDLDKNMFMKNNVLMDMVKVGAQLMMQTSDGRPIAGIVREIGDNHVKMDFNHDMAGKHLHFSGEILDVRESTDEDFSAGGCAGCGGSCGEGSCESCSGKNDNNDELEVWFINGMKAYNQGDYKEAVDWFTKAGNQGNGDACFMMASCYNDGKGVEKNPILACVWHQMGAENGNMECAYFLGGCHYYGCGTPEDKDKGIRWWRIAAQNGIKGAQEELRKRNLTW